MKNHISPFQFSNYREFLRVALKARGYSYRSFSDKHGDIVSRIMLAQTLTQGRTGTQNRPMRNLSPETLARIGKVLRLKDQEITFLVLLKLENDSGLMPGLYGSTYIDIMKSLIREHRFRATDGDQSEGTGGKKYSPAAQILAELFDLFPSMAKIRLAREMLLEGRGILSRQKRRAGLKAMTTGIQQLEKLISAGLN